MSSKKIFPSTGGPSVAIKCQNLTKYYKVYLKPIDRLKEVLTRRVYHQRVDALTEVSFNIRSGETWGLIGDNGAGKSTLLKILAGTVMPVAGDLRMKGRVAALLELGSGFHPEFSGRRNIYLNAALLGLNETEIRLREDEIIAFAELEEVIDRPVKTYSSGMYVRLAFSIATSVDPDILIIDEALAVGDNHFQRKCVERLIEFRERQKTILFCSHSMFLINELCDHCLWLAGGRIQEAGDAAEVVGKYMADQERRISSSSGTSTTKPSQETEQPAENTANMPKVIIESLEMINAQGQKLEHCQQSTSVVFRYQTRCPGEPFKGHLGFGIINAEEKFLFATMTHHLKIIPICFSGMQEGTIEIPSMVFQGDNFRAVLAVLDVHGLLVIDTYYSEPFAVLGKRPDMGLLWMDHVWCPPGKCGS